MTPRNLYLDPHYRFGAQSYPLKHAAKHRWSLKASQETQHRLLLPSNPHNHAPLEKCQWGDSRKMPTSSPPPSQLVFPGLGSSAAGRWTRLTPPGREGACFIPGECPKKSQACPPGQAGKGPRFFPLSNQTNVNQNFLDLLCSNKPCSSTLENLALKALEKKPYMCINIFFLLQNVIRQPQRDRISSIITQTEVAEASACSSAKTGTVSACSNPVTGG